MRGNNMKYEEPNIELVVLEMEDIVCMSNGGTSDAKPGGWV